MLGNHPFDQASRNLYRQLNYTAISMIYIGSKKRGNGLDPVTGFSFVQNNSDDQRATVFRSAISAQGYRDRPSTDPGMMDERLE